MSVLVTLAAETPAEAPAPTGGVLLFLLDHPFAIGLTFVFLVAIVGAFIAARKRDRCLKNFARFHVVLAEQAGRRIWGRLKVFSKGLELVYDTPFDRPAKQSFLCYEAELGKILALYRFTDRLEAAHVRRRRRQAHKLSHPPVRSRLWRWFRNIVNTFRDAVVTAMGMTVQQATAASTSPALKAQGGQINAIGTLLVGETANAYEPIIEQYIGRPVILELVNPADPEKRVREHHGYLGEYSAQFVLLAKVRERFQEKVPLAAGPAAVLETQVRVRPDPEAGTLAVENASAVAVTVEGITAGEVCAEIGREVAPGETVEVAFEAALAETEGAVAAISAEREFELIVPRACGVIRHASEPP